MRDTSSTIKTIQRHESFSLNCPLTSKAAVLCILYGHNKFMFDPALVLEIGKICFEFAERCKFRKVMKIIEVCFSRKI